MSTVDVVHMGGEVKTLAVVGFTDTALFLLWPMCGVYELKVMADDPILVMRRNRGSWRAKDKEAARETLRAYHRERDKRLRAARYGGNYEPAKTAEVGNQHAGHEHIGMLSHDDAQGEGACQSVGPKEVASRR